MKKRNYKKYLEVIVLTMLLCLVLGGQVAVAQTTPPTSQPVQLGENNFSTFAGGGNCLTNLPTCLIYYTSLAGVYVLHLFIIAGAAIIDWGIQLDSNVFNTSTVQIGFSVSLILANLGFVIGIIVIALATILRREDYGIKKLLWKLVIMAIFVNFGLVVTAPIVGFSDSLSNYFVMKGQGTSASFSSALTADFAPQSLFQQPSPVAQQAIQQCSAIFPYPDNQTAYAYQQCIDDYESANAVSATQQQTGIGALDEIWRAILSLLFSIVFAAIVAFTFLTIGILLLVRYVYLGILLIILPLAWLTWIFPKFSGNFSKWWKEFIRWAFFPAISLFFVYLAMQTVQLQAAGNTAPQLSITGAQANSPAGAAIAYATGQASMIQTALNELLLVGLCLGGLVAANSLGIKGADMAVSMGQSASKAVGGYVGKQGQKAGRATFNAAGGGKMVEKMRSNKIPVLGRITSLAGRAIEPHLTNKSMVEEAKKKVPEDDHKIKENLKGNMNMEDTLAHIAKLVEKGKLTDDVMVRGKSIKEFMDDNQKVIKENYGMEHLGHDADISLGSNEEMRKAEKTLAGMTEGTAEYQRTFQRLNDETRKFVGNLKKGDVAKMNVDGMFRRDTPASRNLLANIQEYNPGLMAPMISKGNGSTGEVIRAGIAGLYSGHLASLVASGKGEWQSDPELVSRGNEINGRLQELEKRTAEVKADTKMNADQRHQAEDRINDETKKLKKEFGDMQSVYEDKMLNKKYPNREIIDKAIASAVFGPPAPH